jgi:hypothetical protein
MTLDILTAAAIAPVQHGFFTRKGGVSSGIYQGLNCGFGSADSAQNVRHNRDLVAKSFGIDRTHLISVHQTHSTQVTIVQGPITEPVQSDAMVTDQPGLALAILTADCQPVLFSDPVAGVIGAAHAGWRGTLDGILESTLDAMETLGAKRAQIRAVIGPSISQGAYEVGPDFLITSPWNILIMRVFSLVVRTTACSLTSLVLACSNCAKPALDMPNGPGIAPIQNRIDFILIDRQRTVKSRTMDG